MSLTAVCPSYRTGSRGPKISDISPMLQNTHTLGLGLNPGPPDAVAHARGVGPLGGCLASAFREGGGALWARPLCSSPKWLLLPSGPAALAEAAPCRARCGSGWQSEKDTKVWEMKRLLFFPGFFTNNSSEHTARGWAGIGPGLGQGKPKPQSVALTYHPGQGNSVGPEEASVCSFSTHPKQVLLEPIYYPRERRASFKGENLLLREELSLDRLCGW